MSKKRIEDEISGEEIFRPYARLITILGDQLITNKLVAINEIVKNSYDADAENVTVRFINFENFGKPNIPINKRPCIEIEDDGDGMSITTIREIWLRPATPNKLNKKKGDLRFTSKGRLMQGEKGIGRFAVHKIGDEIDIYTKTNGGKEAQLVLNLGEYDQGTQLEIFTSQSDIDKNYKFLDEIKNKWYVNAIPKRINKPKGTLIQIRKLRDSWTKGDLQLLDKSFSNLIPPTIPEDDRKDLQLKLSPVKDFNIEILWNGLPPELDKLMNINFESLCDSAPFKFIGDIDSSGQLNYIYESHYNGSRKESKSVNLLDNSMNLSLYAIKKNFFITDPESKDLIKTHNPATGPFKFILYGFDLFDKAKWKTRKNELEFIKDNSVYVFRDGIRVYPYGNKEIDWLELGKMRAEYKAGDFFSYNDLIGFIFISHDDNAKLKDATNREGLMNIEGAYEDFKALMIASIQVMKYESDLDKGEDEKRKKIPIDIFKKNLTLSFNNLSNKISKIGDKDIQETAKKYYQSTNSYLKEMNRRAEIYEDLAGLGLAVEKASHDAISLIEKMNANLKDIKKRLLANEELTKKELIATFADFEDNTQYLYDQLQLIQPLFVVSKRNQTIVSLEDIVKKTFRYFRLEFESYNITAEINVINDIKLKSSIGLILQVMINLTDNSVFWLNDKGTKDVKKRILITIDSAKNEIIFADNGIGISTEIEELIFMEFYTTKPKERGRGLGLFIVKEIIDRLGGTIQVIQSPNHKILSGANFRIIFNQNI